MTGKWKRYGTPFLFWFILLHLLWAVMSPFLQILLSTEIVKTPKTTWSKANTPDIIVKLGRTKYYADKYFIYRLLCCENSETTSPNDSPSLLWPENENCTFLSATSLNKTILCASGEIAGEIYIFCLTRSCQCFPGISILVSFNKFSLRFNFKAIYR